LLQEALYENGEFIKGIAYEYYNNGQLEVETPYENGQLKVARRYEHDKYKPSFFQSLFG